MANRSVTVELKAEISDFRRAMWQASQAAKETAAESTKKFAEVDGGLNKLIQTSAKYPQTWEKVGTGMLVAGAGIMGGLGLATKAAIDWESAWAGVTKTVDGTPEQMKSLERGLRDLSTQLPASSTEIAAVAEAAGQLGIATPNVLAFTRTMIDLGETTNLSAEEAATTLARFMNIMGTSQDQVSNLGSAIVGLGNNFATTESEIATMAMRLGAAGKASGMSEGEVLGLATAMSSLGIEAEAGGTAMTMVMNKITKAVEDGGGKLDGFAETSGMTAQEFAAKWKADPATALQMFMKGLDGVQQSGGSVLQTLDMLGIKGVREQDSVRRLAGSYGLLGDAMRLGNDEQQKNTALAEEAAKRYETSESKIRIAFNQLKDAMIDVGASIAPVVVAIAEGAAGIAKAFSDLPGPVKAAIGPIGLVAGVSLLAVGGLMKLITFAGSARGAMDALGVSSSKAKGLIGGLGKAGAAGAGLMLVAAGIKAIDEASRPAAQSLSDLNNQMLGLGAGDDAALNQDFFKRVAKDITDLDGVIQKAFSSDANDNINSFFDTISGGFISSEMGRANDAIKQMGESLASLSQAGQTEQAAAAFNKVSDAFERNGRSAQDALNSMPAYADFLRDQFTQATGQAATEQDLLALATGQIPPAMAAAQAGAEGATGAVEGMGAAADATEQSMSKLLEGMFAMGLATQSAWDAASRYQSQLRDITDKTLPAIAGQVGVLRDANTGLATTFDLTTEAGVKASDAFTGLASGGMNEVKAMAEQGLSQDALQAKLNQTYTDLIEVGVGMGLTRQDAESLTRAVLGVPDGVDIQSWMSDSAQVTAQNTKAAIDSIPSEKTVNIYQNVWRQIQDWAADVTGGGRANGGAIGHMASGGGVYGPGSGTSDTAGLFALSNGEHVLTAREVQKMGGQKAVYQFRSDLMNDQFRSTSVNKSTTVNQTFINPVSEPSSTSTERRAMHTMLGVIT